MYRDTGGLMRHRLVWIVGLLALSACSNRSPSESDASAALSARITSSVKGAQFEIKSFEKTNGQMFESSGIKEYRFFYSAAVAFPNGYRPECVQHASNFSGFNCMLSFGATTGEIVPQPPGATVNYSGEITFQNSERGWLSEAVTLQEQSKVIENENVAQLSNGNPNFLVGKNWGDGDGYVLLFDTPSASTRQNATNVSAFWGDFLEKAGAQSYKIEWHSPSRIMVCVQNDLNPSGVKQSIMQNSPGASELRVIAEFTFAHGNCDYDTVIHH